MLGLLDGQKRVRPVVRPSVVDLALELRPARLSRGGGGGYLVTRFNENGCDSVHDGAPKLLGTAVCSWSVLESEKWPVRILTEGNSKK